MANEEPKGDWSSGQGRLVFTQEATGSIPVSPTERKRAGLEKGRIIQKERYLKRAEDWANDPKKFCKNCDKALSYDERKKTFCGHSCAASYNNIRFPKKTAEKFP